MLDVITIGSVSRDVFFLTREGRVIDDTVIPGKKFLAFEYGSKIIPENSLFTYGGAGANTAISFSLLGLKTATVVNIGSEGTGDLVLGDLKKAGVNCKFVNRDKNNHTALSIIIDVPGEDHIMFLHRGSNDYINIKNWKKLKSKWIYLSSLTGESTALIPKIFTLKKEKGIKIAWNPGSEQLSLGYSGLADFLSQTDVLILNRNEATKLALSKDGNVDFCDEKSLLRTLYEMTGGIVVITDGHKGSYAIDGKNEYFEPIKKVEVLETTGAGDAFGSTFVTGMIRGFDVRQCMEMASFNSANVIRFIGAQAGLMTIRSLSAKMKKGGN